MKISCAVVAALLLVWAKAETTDETKTVLQKKEDNDDDNSVDIKSVQAQSKEEFDESATQEDLDRMIKNLRILREFRWLLNQQENKNKDEEDENSFIESLAKEMIVREQSIERAKNLFRKINSGEIKLLQSPGDTKTSSSDSEEEKQTKTKDDDDKETTDKDNYIESWLRKKSQMKNIKILDSSQQISLNEEEEEDFGWWDEEKPEEFPEEEPVPLTPQEQEGIIQVFSLSYKLEL